MLQDDNVDNTPRSTLNSVFPWTNSENPGMMDDAVGGDHFL